MLSKIVYSICNDYTMEELIKEAIKKYSKQGICGEDHQTLANTTTEYEGSMEEDVDGVYNNKAGSLKNELKGNLSTTPKVEG